MPNLADLHLKADLLKQYGLPDIPYPVPATQVQEALTSAGHLPFALLLQGLQDRSRDLATGWRDLELAMDRLAQLLTPDDPRETVTAEGESWWLEIGPVDLEGQLVTIQRDGELIAAMTRREDGHLRVAVYRPLDGKSCEYLCGLGQRPYNGAVCMRENNWEYALDCSAGMGNVYASEAREAYLSYWEKGIGISHDDTVLPPRTGAGIAPSCPGRRPGSPWSWVRTMRIPLTPTSLWRMSRRICRRLPRQS